MSTYNWESVSPIKRDRIDEGERACGRIDDYTKQTFYDWLRVGDALDEMQQAAMELAGANQPTGKAYNAAFAVIKARAPKLAAIDKSVRSKAIFLAQNREAVEAWHATLPVPQKRLLNHPNAVRRQFERDTGVTEERERPRHRRGDAASAIETATVRLHGVVDDIERKAIGSADLFDMSPERIGESARNFVEIYGGDDTRRFITELEAILAPPPEPERIDAAFTRSLRRGRSARAPT